ETRPVFFDARIASETLMASNLPSWVVVRSANRAVPVVYDMPRGELRALLARGRVVGRAFGETKLFWFKSTAFEEQWWKAVTGSKGSKKAPRRSPAMRVATTGGAWPDSLGRIWTCWGSDSAWPAIYQTNHW